VNSESYNLSEFLDSFLQPLAAIHPAYIKDSFDFVEKIRNIEIPQHTLLITADVESMYTNIQHEAGLAAVKSCLDRNPDPNRPPTKTLLELLKLTLTRNDMYFNGEFFLQICGTAMGKKYAPSYANIFMAEWERTVWTKCPYHPLFYGRFLDDIYMLWTHGKEKWDECLKILNSDNPCITLTAEVSPHSANFLDLTTFKGPQFKSKHTLDTKVYHKPTDTMQLLHIDSHHPPHTFKGLIKSQILRFHRLTSSRGDFEASCKELFQALTPRGYKWKFLQKIKQDTLYQIRHPESKHKTPTSYPTLHTRPAHHHLGQAKSCKGTRCLMCPYIPITTEVISSATKTAFPIHGQLDCKSCKVVYVVTCDTCMKQYVGQTRNNLQIRFANHRRDIKTAKAGTLGAHFAEHQGEPQYTVTPVFQAPSIDENGTESTLEEVEAFYIKVLKTQTPHGLNTILQVDRPILPIVIPYSAGAKKWANRMKLIWDGFFRQEFPIRLPHRPITAYSLGGPSLARLLTSTNIRPSITVTDVDGQEVHWQTFEQQQMNMNHTLDT
jgi:hypothetical protein